jgi:GTP-binding protein HflX
VRRIHKLESDLRDISRHRTTQRKQRSRSRLQHVAIVGYTNAGKSTLLNRLTDAGVLVEDRLFATLDATTRRLSLPGGESVLLTDTVGFIRKLPHGLVEAFKSTLEVVNDADLLVHVVDASAAEPEMQIDAVRDVLGEIDADALPELLAINKADLDPARAAQIVDRNPGSVAISATTGEGMEELLRTIGDRLRSLTNVVELIVPYERGDVLAAVHREGEVLGEQADDDAMRLRVRLDPAAAGRFKEFHAPGHRS